MEISVLLEPDIGGKGEKNMDRRKIIYTEAPKDIVRALSEGKKVVDFLPPPEKLIRKEPKVKITITLNTGSIDFFKRYARKNNVKYQTMINEVLARYVQKYKEKIIV
jgi:uncharacterized protein (DUF4415 family)